MLQLTKSLILILIFLAGKEINAQQSAEMTLPQAQDYAVKNAYALKSSLYDAEAAKYTTESLKAIGLPQINGSVAFQNNIYAPYTLIPPGTFGPEATRVRFGNPYALTLGITASQLLFDGTYLVGLQAARAYELLQNQAIKKSEQQVKSDVANAYYLALISQENNRLIKENREAISTSLEQTTALYENGFTELESVEQLQLTLSDLDVQINYADEQVKLMRDMLKFQMGFPLSSELLLLDKIENFMEQSAGDLLNTTFSADVAIDVQLSRSTLNLRELNMRAKKAAYLPSLSTAINFQTSAYRTQFDVFDSSKPYFYGNVWTVNLNVPILSGGARKYDVKKTQVEVQRSLDLLTLAQQSAELEFRSARTELDNALRAYNSSQKSLELAQSIQNKTQIKFQEGIGTSFDITQRNTQLIQTQGSYIQAMVKVLSAKTRLTKALNQL